jgi:hypothetical protein
VDAVGAGREADGDARSALEARFDGQGQADCTSQGAQVFDEVGRRAGRLGGRDD